MRPMLAGSGLILRLCLPSTHTTIVSLGRLVAVQRKIHDSFSFFTD
jgi:hypothetical protein